MATAKNVSTENKINIVTNTENNVTVTQPSIQTVEVLTGPQGSSGTAGAIGPAGPTGSLNLTSSLGPITINGNLTISGSISISGSGTIITSNDTGSFITNSQTGSFITNSQTGSFITNSQTSSMTVLSSSFAVTSSFISSTFISASAAASGFGSGGGGSSTPAGNDQEIQFNNNGSFDGDSKLKYIHTSQSLEQGNQVTASGLYSHAEGRNANASAESSHAEGWFTKATGISSHAEGRESISSGNWSHAEGIENTSSGLYSHASGEMNEALGRASFVAGDENKASAAWSMVVGNKNVNTNGQWSFAAGYANTSTEAAYYSTVLGYQSHVLGWAAVAMGRKTSASFYGFASGDETLALFAAHAEGRYTIANSRYTHAEGVSTTAGGRFVQGFTSSATEPTSNWGDDDPGAAINDGDIWYNTSNTLLYSFTGSGFPSGSSPTSSAFIPQNSALLLSPIPITFFSTSSGLYSSASFGSGDTFPPTSASAAVAARTNYGTAKHSHVEGVLTQTYGRNSHAEGKTTTAGGFASHTEGLSTRTGVHNEYGPQPEGGSGSYAHAEGKQTQAVGIASHAEGLSSRALGDYSHAEGLLTIAKGDYQHTMGRYNHPNTHSLVIIGNGSNSSVTSSLIEFNRDGIVINEPITGSTFNIEANTIISDNSDTELFRVTQTGTGDAIRIEDAGNPDSTPTVITNAGDVLIGTGSRTLNNNKLYIKEGDAGSLALGSGNTVAIESNTTNYLGLFAPDNSFSGIVMGSPSDGFGAFIRWQYDSGRLQLGAAKTNHGIEFTVGNKGATSMQLKPDATSTSNYNATLTVTGSIRSHTGSFGVLTGLSPITVKDSMIFEQPITASSNISASGNLIGNNLVIGGGTFTSASLAAGGGGGSSIDTGSLGSTQITGSLNVSGSITTFDINMSTWTLGADGGSNYYYFTGPGDLGGTEQNPDIYLTRGQKYRFYNPLNAHPFQIQDTGGSAFSTGVTNNGVQLGFLSFDVPMDGPTHLLYQCTAHAAMKGNIYIADARVASGSFSGSFQGNGSQLTNLPASNPFPLTGDAVITGSLIISSSATSQSLSIVGSGSTVFDIIGSVGTLFSVDDSLTGTLFSANDISGFPVLQAESTGEVYLGKSPQSLYTTAVVSSTTAATTHSLVSLSTSSYDGAFFEYTAISQSNARAGSIMSVWNGANIVSTETTSSQIGNTTDLTTKVIISGSTARLIAYGPNASYKIKTIIKAI